jgi:hypothetical protein
MSHVLVKDSHTPSSSFIGNRDMSTMATTYDPSPPRLLEPIPPSRRAIHAFLSRHLDLLVAERQAEIDQTSLLASKCSPKLLEKRGLAIGGQYGGVVVRSDADGGCDRTGGVECICRIGREDVSLDCWIRRQSGTHLSFQANRTASAVRIPQLSLATSSYL